MEFNGTFFVTIISFLVFVFLMNKVLYAPILNIMEERRSFIEGNYKAASDNDSKSETLLNEKDEKLKQAKDDAREKYLETLGEFKSQKSDMIQSAQESSKNDSERSKQELENLSNEVKNGLKGSMNDLANDIVEKVIGYRSAASGFDDEAVNKALWG